MKKFLVAFLLLAFIGTAGAITLNNKLFNPTVSGVGSYTQSGSEEGEPPVSDNFVFDDTGGHVFDDTGGHTFEDY